MTDPNQPYAQQPPQGWQPQGWQPPGQQQGQQPPAGYHPLTPHPDQVADGGNGRRSRGRWIAVTAGAAAVVLAAGLTYVLIGGDDGPTGAASPEEAVRNLASAITKQDPAALVSSMNPAEVQNLGAVISSVRGKVSATGLVQKNGPLASWATISVDGLQVKKESQPRDDFAFVEVTGGTAGVRIDRNKAPKGLDLPGSANGGSVDIGRVLDDANLDYTPVIATIKTSAGWFISPSTTLLELGRREGDFPEPSWSSAQNFGNGGSSPDAALQGLVESVNRRDPIGVMGYIDPAEVPAAKYYYRSFASQIDRALRRADDFRISNLRTSTSNVSDSAKRVTISSVDLEANGDEARYASGCVTTNDRRPSCLTSKISKLTGIRDAAVIVTQRGNRWYVSPVATALAYAKQFLTEGSPNALYLLGGRHLLELLPPSQTIATGKQRVKLNDAGFAVVTIKAPAGSCVSDEGEYGDSGDDYYLSRTVGDTESCENESDSEDYYYGDEVPSNGELNVVVTADPTGSDREITVEFVRH